VPDAVGYPAVRLFADRATAVRPDFEVDATNLDQVVRICAALDGLPLAIELAAGRLRSLTVADVGARLDAASGCSPGVIGPPRRGTGRCARSSSGAGACWPRPSRCWPGG
jgi:hypothetical protein